MEHKTNQAEVRDVIHAVARIHAGILAVVCATLGGGGLFLMTVWLVIKGGPQVGPHLQLLAQFFYGYTVTWSGSLIGLFYGALVGAIVGYVLGSVYNGVVALRR